MKRLFLHIFLLTLPVIASAQHYLTLDSCLSMAVESNHRLAASRKGVDAARFDVKRARSNFFPSFSASGTGIYSSGSGHLGIPGGMLPVMDAQGFTGASAYFPGFDLDYKINTLFMAGVKFEQPVYFGGKIKTGYEMSKLALELSRLQESKTRADVIIETVNAYADVVKCDHLLSLAESYKGLLTELRRMTESAVRNGMKTRNDLLRVKVKLDESELNIVKARNAGRLARMMLCVCIGTEFDPDLRVEHSMPQLPEGAENLSGNYMDRPEYHMSELSRTLSLKNVTMAKSEWLPQIGLTGSYAYTHGFKLNDENLFHKWNFFVGLNISIPIYHFGEHRNRIQASEARYRQAAEETEHVHEMLRLDMTQAMNRLDEACMAHRIAESGVEAAEENLRMSTKMYEQGVETLSDLLDAQTAWLDMSQNLVEASVNRYRQWMEYRRAVGLLSSEP